jgi:hypothetical protein
VMLRYLTIAVSNATVERAFAQVKDRTKDPQASLRSNELTEGLVKAVTNYEMIRDMVAIFIRGCPSYLRVVRPQNYKKATSKRVQ